MNIFTTIYCSNLSTSHTFAGKGENIFDHLFHTHPDIVVGRQNADVSADSYHRFKDDVQMLKNVGVRVAH